MTNTKEELLWIIRRNNDGFALKLLTRAINLEKALHKKAANAPTDQSEALTATDTTGNGCQGHCTTAAGGNQEEE